MLYPVTQALIPPDWLRDPPIVPRLLIFHTAVSNAAAPGPSAPDAGGLEWHFYIAEDGEIVQRRDTAEEADANYHANSFVLDGIRYGAISVETWDGGDPEGNPWTDRQVDSIVRLCHLAHNLDAIALQRPVVWTGPGMSYHRQFDDWNHPYHSCPGNTRAVQFDTIIWPKVMHALPVPTGDDEDMRYYLFVGHAGGRWWITDLLTGTRPCDSLDDALNTDYMLRTLGQVHGLVCNRAPDGSVAGPIAVNDAWLATVTSHAAVKP